MNKHGLLLRLCLSIGLATFAHGGQFDYQSPATGSAKCALINVIMDESGSMDGDQEFMRVTALPRMARALYTPTYGYNDVFLCSSGFGHGSDKGNAGLDNVRWRSHGCTAYNVHGVAADSSVTAWQSSGQVEDGWAAMQFGMEDVPDNIVGKNLLSHCSTIDKNMILVTDEDRDDRDSTLSATGVKNSVKHNGYVLNVIADVDIDSDADNIGLKIADGGNSNTIYHADSSAPEKYVTIVDTTRSYKDFADGFKDTNTHYSDLVVDTWGAVFNIQSMRSQAAVFADVFVAIKVLEISEGSGGSSGGCGERCENSEGGGDPHFTTWKNEHYEYHGQCDLVMMSDPKFADDLGLDIHIRTKIVRYWSYIKSVAIRIGNDILEIEGTLDEDDAEPHYWINYEYQGELDDYAGFTVTQEFPVAYKGEYKIDLSPKYQDQYILVQLFKEFVRVQFHGGEEVFGNTVGLLGDYNTGKTFARDGSTVMNDFVELGDEWQVIPSEPKLFHEIIRPQFPQKCIQPEDPRGDRRRRLAESTISIEQAEEVCAQLKDPLTIKDCVYDILATQDLDMVGAF